VSDEERGPGGGGGKKTSLEITERVAQQWAVSRSKRFWRGGGWIQVVHETGEKECKSAGEFEKENWLDTPRAVFIRGTWGGKEEGVSAPPGEGNTQKEGVKGIGKELELGGARLLKKKAT